jgi:hypothetical protein
MPYLLFHQDCKADWSVPNICMPEMLSDWDEGRCVYNRQALMHHNYSNSFWHYMVSVVAMGKNNRVDALNIVHLHAQPPANMSPTSTYAPIFDSPSRVVLLLYSMFIWLHNITKKEDIDSCLIWANMAHTLICMFCSCSAWCLKIIAEQQLQTTSSMLNNGNYIEPLNRDHKPSHLLKSATKDSASTIVPTQTYELRSHVTSNNLSPVSPSKSSGAKHGQADTQPSLANDNDLPIPSLILVSSHLPKCVKLTLPEPLSNYKGDVWSSLPPHAERNSVSAPVQKQRPRARPVYQGVEKVSTAAPLSVQAKRKQIN